MEFTKEMIEKAKAAKSAEELRKLAKAEGMELSAEEANAAFARLSKIGELSDEELDNVVGGCTRPSPDGGEESEKDVVLLYHVGQIVEHITGPGTKRSVIERAYVARWFYKYFPTYDLRELDSNELIKRIRQDDIERP